MSPSLFLRFAGFANYAHVTATVRREVSRQKRRRKKKARKRKTIWLPLEGKILPKLLCALSNNSPIYIYVYVCSRYIDKDIAILDVFTTVETPCLALTAQFSRLVTAVTAGCSRARSHYLRPSSYNDSSLPANHQIRGP